MKRISALKIFIGVAAIGTVLWTVYHFFIAPKPVDVTPGSGTPPGSGTHTGSTGTGTGSGNNTGSTGTTTPPPTTTTPPPVAPVMKKNSRLTAFTKTLTYSDSNLTKPLLTYWLNDPIYFETGEYIGTVQTDGPYGGSIYVKNYSAGDKLGDVTGFYVVNKPYTITN